MMEAAIGKRVERTARLGGMVAALALVAVPAWSPALAQDSGGYRVRVGAGAAVRPDWPGSDSHEVLPLISVNVARGDHIFRFKAPDDSFGIEVMRQNGFSFGPVVNWVSSRKDKDVGAPLGKVKSSVELGAFAQYDLTESLRLRGELRQGVSGHKGMVGQIGIDQVWRDGDKYVFSVGPRLTFANGRYNRAYFEVTPEAALLTGLPVYDPGSSVLGVAIASGLSYQFNDTFGMFGYAKAERLIGDAGKSPVVREFGSRSQLSAGLGLTYTFRIRK
jgi:outer membrane protein